MPLYTVFQHNAIRGFSRVVLEQYDVILSYRTSPLFQNHSRCWNTVYKVKEMIFGPQSATFWGVKMFFKCLLEDSSSTVSVVSSTFAICSFSFVAVMHRQQTTANEWGIHCPFRNSDKQLLNLYRGRLAMACWVKQLHRYYNACAIHFSAEYVCLLPSFSLSVSLALSQPPQVSEVHIILVKRLSPV